MNIGKALAISAVAGMLMGTAVGCGGAPSAPADPTGATSGGKASCSGAKTDDSKKSCSGDKKSCSGAAGGTTTPAPKN